MSPLFPIIFLVNRNNNNNNNDNCISSILLIVVLHVYNGNKRHIKRATQYSIIYMVHTIKKNVFLKIKYRCKVAYANVSNPQISYVPGLH